MGTPHSSYSPHPSILHEGPGVGLGDPREAFRVLGSPTVTQRTAGRTPEGVVARNLESKGGLIP